MKTVAAIIDEAVEAGFVAATPARTPSAKSAAVQNLAPFDIGQIRKLTDVNQIISYIETTQLKNSLVGEGSSRIVYKYSDQYALKVAKSAAGVAQNKAEQAACSTEETKNLFTKVAEVGPGASWLLVEFAAAINDAIFRQKTGIEFSDFVGALAALPGATRTVKPENKALLQKVGNNQFFKNLVVVINACHYKHGDLAKMDSWGITPDNRLVILDSGFTEAVSMAYYRSAPVTAKGSAQGNTQGADMDQTKR